MHVLKNSNQPTVKQHAEYGEMTKLKSPAKKQKEKPEIKERLHSEIMLKC